MSRGSWRVAWRGWAKTTPKKSNTFGIFGDETKRDTVVESLKADFEVRAGRPTGY
jgi:hypothetical protein